MLDLGQIPIQSPYRLCYRERHGLRELLEYEPKYRRVKQRCANCGYKQTVSGEEGIDGYRMYPGEKYRMDGIVSLCKICKAQVLAGHQERHSCFGGAPISRPVMGMPIHVLNHGDGGDYQVSRAVETVWKNIPRNDRKKIKDYIVDDQRKDSDYCGSVVGRGVLSVEVLWDWPSRKRGVLGTCAADGHFIRLRSREVKGDFECALGLFAHELAHTFQYATDSVLLREYAKRKVECEADAERIARRWGF